MSIRIGSLELGKRPAVVAIVDQKLALEEIAALRGEGVDLLELRVDLIALDDQALVDYLSSIRTSVGLPMIGTVRETETNTGRRVATFNSILPYVDAIDIELGSPLSREVTAAAAGKTIIVSEHDFTSTPDEAALHGMVARSLDQGAHIVKLATMANSPGDVTRLLRFTEDCSVPLVTIAMGPLGTVSRVIAPLFGSLFTYGFIRETVAPGQLSAKKLVEELNLYYPGR